MKYFFISWTFLLLTWNECVAFLNVTSEILRGDDAHLNKILFEMMKSFMDPSADPCQNFHQYACGNFHTKKMQNTNMVELVMTYIDISLNKTINALPQLFKAQPNITQSDPRRKVWAYYESCMDSEFNKVQGLNSLLKQIQGIEAGLAFNETWEGPNSTFGVILGKLRNVSYTAFIEADVYADIEEPTKNILYLHEPENSFLRGYFNQSASFKDQIPYKVMSKVGKVVRSFIPNHIKIGKLKKELVQFEHQYRKISKRSEKRPPLYEQHEKLSIEELQSKIPDFDWIGYLKQFRENNLDLQEKVIVVNIDYFKNLTKLLKTTTNIAISRVMIDFAETYLNLMGLLNSETMWVKCIDQTSELMTETVSYLFAEYVGFEHYPELVNMSEDLRQKYADMIQRTKWIEPENKPIILDKLQKVDLNAMGLPKNFLNSHVRRSKLSGVKIKRNFFQNTMRLKSNLVKQEMELIGKPLNDDEMGETSENLFAEHDYVKNKVSIGMGYLSPPFFHGSFPAFYQFGILGYVIAHEMAHAFDPVGMYFFGDKPDHFTKLYTKKSANKLKKIVKCYRDEYRLAGIRPGASQETIPDSIGIKVAYETYLSWKENNNDVIETIPGLNLTDSQLFFLSFALPMCSKPVINGTNDDPNVPHPYGNLANYNHDPKDLHPPQTIRLLGILRLSEEFAKTFKCPLNSKMNPITKCAVLD